MIFRVLLRKSRLTTRFTSIVSPQPLKTHRAFGRPGRGSKRGRARRADRRVRPLVRRRHSGLLCLCRPGPPRRGNAPRGRRRGHGRVDGAVNAHEAPRHLYAPARSRARLAASSCRTRTRWSASGSSTAEAGTWSSGTGTTAWGCRVRCVVGVRARVLVLVRRGVLRLRGLRLRLRVRPRQHLDDKEGVDGVRGADAQREHDREPHVDLKRPCGPSSRGLAQQSSPVLAVLARAARLVLCAAARGRGLRWWPSARSAAASAPARRRRGIGRAISK